MKIIFKRILIVLDMLIMITNIFNICMNKSKAASYSFNFTGPTEATKGDTVTLTIVANGLTGNVKISASNVTISDSQKWVEKNSVSITARISAFPAKITATPVELTDNDYNIVSLSSKTITINEKVATTAPTTPSTTTPPSATTTTPSQTTTTTKPNQTTTTTNKGQQSPSQSYVPIQTTQGTEIKSSNNYLKSLLVSVGTLSPEFYRETFEYTIDNIVENDIEIIAEAENDKATINGAGSVALKDGENKINIEVTAENGSTRTYTITINKKYTINQSDLRLESLKIEKINEEGKFIPIDINFQKEKYDYEFDIEDDITDLNILSTTEKEGIIIQTDGANNLKEGKNTIIITLTNQEDTSMKTMYTLTLNKASKPIIETSTKTEKQNKWKYIITIFIIIVILVTGAIIFIKKRSEK